MYIKKILVFCLLFVAFILNANTSFVLKDSTIVFNEVVKLNDIALMDKNTNKRIGDLVISASPKIGNGMLISKNEIYAKLIGNGIIKPNIKGAKSVLVNRNGKTISAKFFKSRILNYIKKYSKWKTGLSLKIVSTKQIIIPEAGVIWKIIPVNGQDFFGNILFKIKAYKANKELYSDWIIAKLKIEKKVAIANRIIRKNELIGKDDIRWEEREITAFIKNAVFNPKLIIGRRSGRTIRTNTVITTNNLASEYLVRRGFLSSLTAKYKSIRAIADVIPMTNGKYGDMVKVINKNTKKILTAIVIGQNKMEVIIR